MRTTNFCRIWITMLLGPVGLSAQITSSEYTSFLPEFSALHGSSVFPVLGKSLDDVESTFGPRVQISTNLYDFHRGIDVHGMEGDDILAVTDGVFWEYREFMAGGFTVILRHDFSTPVTLNVSQYHHYFTYCMHLNDVGTQPVINGWVEEKNNPGNGQVITAGQHIGEMGNSGSSGGAAYADHLHMELRVGTTNSLQFQTDVPESTQHGSDPHLHSLLFPNPPSVGRIIPPRFLPVHPWLQRRIWSSPMRVPTNYRFSIESK